MQGLPRRRVLALGFGALGFGTVAGCTGRPNTLGASDSSGPTAQASFFVFGDMAAQVAQGLASVETLVPVGQHGHGWEPGPRVREAIIQADLFVYGLPGFQPWVDDVVRDLHADSHEVTMVGAGEGIDLRYLDDGHDDHASDDSEHDDDHEDDAHDHPAGADPHFWLDLLRARHAVDNILAGFAQVDSDNADAYESNAKSYGRRLADLHETYEAALADRGRDVVLVGGHDAYGYLADRYGFDVAALAGLAPDDRPSPRDIERAQQLIERHDLEYICADPLESQHAAEQLVAETDAREVLPLTAMPGRTQAWHDDGWGYVDVMERVNLPTLRRALAVP